MADLEILKVFLEARVGIEPTHKGFADLSLTTWVPRLGQAETGPSQTKHPQQAAENDSANWR
jgi:hypothetical protein